MSQLSAQSKKPSGLDSGEAIRTYNDIESERFVLSGQQYEQFHLDAAEQMIAAAKDIYEDQRKYQVTFRTKRWVERIDWADIDLDRDQYEMQCFPTSSLPNTPSGRLAAVQEYVQAGFIAREDAQKLLELPDMEAVSSLYNAAVDDIDYTLERMLMADLDDEDADNDNVYAPPEAFQHLALGIRRCQAAYLRAKQEGAPEENLELLRRWMVDAEAMNQDAEPTMAATAQAMPVAA